MSTYVVARVVVKDPSFIEEYIPNVQRLVEAHGGRYLVRTTELDVIEPQGNPPTVLAVLEFPSREAAGKFYSSAEYQPYLAARKACSESELILADGL